MNSSSDDTETDESPLSLFRRLEPITDPTATSYQIPHTPSYGESVYVSRSGIYGAGNGLFASKDIKKGTKIIEYKGVKKNKQDLDREFSEDDVATYWVALQDGETFIDASDIESSSLARYANGYNNNVFEYNAILQETSAGNIYIINTRHILKDEEIILNYGGNYFKEGNDQHSGIKSKNKYRLASIDNRVTPAFHVLNKEEQKSLQVILGILKQSGNYVIRSCVKVFFNTRNVPMTPKELSKITGHEVTSISPMIGVFARDYGLMERKKSKNNRKEYVWRFKEFPPIVDQSCIERANLSKAARSKRALRKKNQPQSPDSDGWKSS